MGSLSVRERNYIAMKVEICRVFNENLQVDGLRKVWRHLQRKDFDIARYAVARPVRMMGLQGVISGKPDPHDDQRPDQRRAGKAA